MVGYVEQLIVFKSNMMALAAEDAALTSAPHLQALLLTPRNIVIQEFLENAHSGNIFHNDSIAGTPCTIPFCVEHPMVINGDTHHHDSCWPVDLTTLQLDIHWTGNLLP